MLRWKKVLFTIDDVNHQEQLEFLVGEPEWFGRGSRIILTARDKHLLISHVGDNVYEVQLLSENEALELFSRLAFREKSPKEGFLELSRYDFHLCVELVRRYMSRGFLIDYLIEKSLLSIDLNNSIVMHNMIRKMGENVIREEYANSRIWLPEEVCDLFKGKLITEKVESLCIPKDYYFEDDLVDYSNIFKRMQSLKIPIVGGGSFNSNCAVTYLPSSLRFIDWIGYPSISLPESFEPSQLVVLCLPESRLVELWPISKKLSNLKHLDLRDSCEFTKTPNFGGIPNLEKLHLEGCVNLEEVHPSIGHCKMLTYLSLYGCRKLKKLPKFVCMDSLEDLNLRECTRLEEFPEICGNMRRLSKLSLGSPWIRSLPPSLSSLRELHLGDCEILECIPDTIRNLSDLRISGCNKLATLPNSLFESQLLKVLCIYGCSGLVKLPISLEVQKNLRLLIIERCENLKKLPSSIQMESLLDLSISKYPKLDTFPEINGDMHCLTRLSLKSTGIREVPSSIGNLSGLTELCLKRCEDLVSLPDSLCNLMNLQYLLLNGCKKLEKLPENMGDLQELCKLDVSETAIYQPPPSITKLGKLIILGLSGLFEDLGSLHTLKYLSLSGSNISCLPKSLKGLLHLRSLNIHFCQNLNELPGELPPNLRELLADYHLALKSIRDLVINCLRLCRLVISNCGAVSSEQVNVFLHHFLRTCIQCDFHQRDYFLITFPRVRISELFDYDCPFINQEKMSIDLNPSWYTNKFMGFWITYGPTTKYIRLEATLVCKSDPERKYSLKYGVSGSFSNDPFIYCWYIPFETLWNASGNKEGKNPNDYYMLEFSHMYGLEKEVCWGIRLVYEEEAMSDDSGHRKKKRSNE
ncbi:TMV resistance protein N-like [Solanum tuberosum]|uniref:TMV resistance protein N-like n=1 Tax=Solanum tuberosum TaxID=4113 RepID=UPI00073A264B|nr:PREDICTED: TMV resistance protein N-like [Solanum tuberosum]